jgi:uncharacterized protein YgfB (UPF0149 family)
MSQPLPDYDQINDALRGAPCELDAAEFHGHLCGLLCTCDRLELADWLMVSLPESDPATLSPAAHELFQAALDHSQTALGSEDFGFQLLLPDDTAGLAARLEALASWCQGFLFGISHAGVADIQGLPGELPEIVEDSLTFPGPRISNWRMMRRTRPPTWNWWSMCVSGCSYSMKNYAFKRIQILRHRIPKFTKTPFIWTD